MSDVIIPYRFLWRGGTASALTTNDEVVKAREAEVETDTGRFKLGDGTTAWSSLTYANLGAVDFTGLADGYVPAWNAASSTFKMVAQSGGGGGGGEGFDSSLVTFVHNDFERAAEWTLTGGGSGAMVTAAAGRSGVIEIKTGTSSTGFEFYYDPVGMAFVPGGSTEIELHYGFKTGANLSDGTNTYELLIGLTSSVSGASSSRLTLRYNSTVNSGNWFIESIVSSATTTVNGSVGPSASTWYRARIVINAAGTSADVYVRPEGGSESLVGTTTAVPAAAMYNVFLIAKNAGTTSRSVFADFATRRHRYGTAR